MILETDVDDNVCHLYSSSMECLMSHGGPHQLPVLFQPAFQQNVEPVGFDGLVALHGPALRE